MATGLGLLLVFFAVTAPGNAAPGELRVRVVTEPVSVTIVAPQGLALTDTAGNSLGTLTGRVSLTLKAEGGRLALPDGRKVTALRIVPQPAEETNLLQVLDRPYRGTFEVKASAAGLSVINVVGVEDYLRSVVPTEMPAGWPEEALKAQAVAARTFAYRNQGRHAAEGFDLCATEHCQVYRGAAAETPFTDQAVRATAGLVLRFQGELINACYHASSGGHTEAAGAVWGTDVPYLQGVNDDFDRSPYSEWEVSFAPAELSALLDKAGYTVGSLEEVVPLSYTPSGRVASFLLRGSAASQTIAAEKFRQILGTTVLKSTWVEVHTDTAQSPDSGRAVVQVQGAGGRGQAILLPGTKAVTASGLQVIVPQGGSRVGSRGGSPVHFVFHGRGYGHGVGLSQWGARGMAEQHTAAGDEFYRQILNYYYQGVSIEPYS